MPPVGVDLGHEQEVFDQHLDYKLDRLLRSAEVVQVSTIGSETRPLIEAVNHLEVLTARRSQAAGQKIAVGVEVHSKVEEQSEVEAHSEVGMHSWVDARSVAEIEEHSEVEIGLPFQAGIELPF
jgi:hypothetical protein